MRWTIESKSKFKESPKIGDKKIKKKFCLFPKSDFNFETGTTTYYWLETVYIVYKLTEGGMFYAEWGENVRPNYWQEIGIATSYSNAIREIYS